MTTARAGLLGVERFVPPYRYDQETVTRYVRDWLGAGHRSAHRYLAVYAAAGVAERGCVIPIDDVFTPADFEARNDAYIRIAREAAVALTRRALDACGLLPSDLHAVVSVSCTGFSIPAIDAYVADALALGPRLMRLPITESGCAGAVVGLGRASEYLAAYPDRAVLLLSMELSSLTFQDWDRSATNIVSTAIFGDGGAAAILVGPQHPAFGRARAHVIDTESVFFTGTTHLMGFRLRNQGLQIVLDRELAPFVRRHVGRVADDFLRERGLARTDVSRWILHPGGRRIIEAMAERLGLERADLAATETVLAEHGNMSSATVLFVLDQVLRGGDVRPGERAVLGAFGPGFAAEFALLTLC